MIRDGRRKTASKAGDRLFASHAGVMRRPGMGPACHSGGLTVTFTPRDHKRTTDFTCPRISSPTVTPGERSGPHRRPRHASAPSRGGSSHPVLLNSLGPSLPLSLKKDKLSQFKRAIISHIFPGNIHRISYLYLITSRAVSGVFRKIYRVASIWEEITGIIPVPGFIGDCPATAGQSRGSPSGDKDRSRS